MIDLANRGGGELKPQATETALKSLPLDFQKPVGWFYGFFREGLKGSASLAIRMRYWIETEGLTLDEAKQAMRTLMTPAKAGEITFGGNQLLAVLAQEVDAIVRERKKRERIEQQRREAADREANRVPPDEVRKTIRTFGEMIGDRGTVPSADPEAPKRNAAFANEHRT